MSLENHIGDLQKATNICKEVLKQNTKPDGFVAGGEYFKTTNWARDSLFASFWVSRSENIQEVEKNLDIYTRFQRNDGAIPNRIERSSHAGDIVNIWPLNAKYKEPLARYKSSQPWAGDTVDTSALYVIAASEYKKNSLNGEKWWNQNNENLNKAAFWLKNKIGKNGLIREGLVAGWKDSHLMSGNVGYTNVCTWKAFKELGWNDDAHRLQKSINENLWNKEKKYYNNWISPKGKLHDEFCADVNVLGIAFGLASDEQSIDIVEFIEDNSLNEIPVKTHHPISDFRRDAWTKTLFPNYDPSKGIFMWWGGWEAIAQKVVGETDKATRDIKKIAEVISNNGTSPETVDFNGKLIGHQKDMTWSAGVFLYSASELGLL